MIKRLNGNVVRKGITNLESGEKKRRGPKTLEEINAIRVPLGFKERLPAPRKPAPAILRDSTKKRTQEILSVMLSKKGRAVVEKVLNKALDDVDPDQMACLKLCMDRMIPVSYFEKEKSSGSKGVTIQILGVGGVGEVPRFAENVIENEDEDGYE